MARIREQLKPRERWLSSSPGPGSSDTPLKWGFRPLETARPAFAKASFLLDLDDDDFLPRDSIFRRVSALLESEARWSFGGNGYCRSEWTRSYRGRAGSPDPAGRLVSELSLRARLLPGRGPGPIGERPWRWPADGIRLCGWPRILITGSGLTRYAGDPLLCPGLLAYYRRKPHGLAADAFRDGSLAPSWPKFVSAWRDNTRRLP